MGRQGSLTMMDAMMDTNRAILARCSRNDCRVRVVNRHHRYVAEPNQPGGHRWRGVREEHRTGRREGCGELVANLLPMTVGLPQPCAERLGGW